MRETAAQFLLLTDIATFFNLVADFVEGRLLLTVFSPIHFFFCGRKSFQTLAIYDVRFGVVNYHHFGFFHPSLKGTLIDATSGAFTQAPF